MRKILYITETPPWPPTSGGRQRSHLLLRALRDCGQVDFLLVARTEEFTTAQVAELERGCGMVGCVRPWERSRHWPWRALRGVHPRAALRLATNFGGLAVAYAPDPELQGWMRRRLADHRYDLIVGRYLRPTAMAGAFAHGPVVLDIDDLDTLVLESQLHATRPGTLKHRALTRQLAQARRIVPRLLAQCRHVWVASENDVALVAPAPATVLPNVPYPPVDDGAGSTPLLPAPPPPPPEGSQVLLMVAAMMHPPNGRGLNWFLREVWPQVRRARPGAVLRIAGGGMDPADVARLRRTPGVEPLGFVEDLRAAYAGCALTIVPVLEGGGTKIKVLEALRFERACVVTEHSHRGYEHVLRDGEALWVGRDAASFAQGCIALLNDPVKRQAMAERGRALVYEHYTYARFASAVRQVVERVAPETDS